MRRSPRNPPSQTVTFIREQGTEIEKNEKNRQDKIKEQEEEEKKKRQSYIDKLNYPLNEDDSEDDSEYKPINIDNIKKQYGLNEILNELEKKRTYISMQNVANQIKKPNFIKRNPFVAKHTLMKNMAKLRKRSKKKERADRLKMDKFMKKSNVYFNRHGRASQSGMFPITRASGLSKKKRKTKNSKRRNSKRRNSKKRNSKRRSSKRMTSKRRTSKRRTSKRRTSKRKTQ